METNLITETTPEIEATPETIEEPVETPTVEKPIKKTKPRTKSKTRKVEELLEAPIRSMSDKEKNILIPYLKDLITNTESKNETLQENCQLAYKKLTMLEKDYAAMEAHYSSILEFVNKSAKTFAQTINLAIKGGLH